MSDVSSRLDTAEPDPEAARAARPAGRGGRRRDASRDTDLLEATLEILAEVGYAALTMEAVAARVKASKSTVYRRWASKGELVVEAVAQMKHRQVDLNRLPDTGTLRGDVLALSRPESDEESERTLRIMAGLASMISDERTLTDAVSDAVVRPWVEAQMILMRRAIDRGEVRASADIVTASRVIPSIAAYRALIQQKPFERDFLVSMLDGVILPALLNQSDLPPSP